MSSSALPSATPASLSDPLASLRQNALAAPVSGIVEIAEYAWKVGDVLRLWVGEGDLPTPAFIAQAAHQSMLNGETFYSYQEGLPSLRAAIAGYLSQLYGQPTRPERIFVTSSGMHALQMATTLIAGPGDEVLVPTPAWPNFIGALTISGARPVEVPMSFGNRGFTLDLERLAAAITPRTKGLVINSPSNPTGWTATNAELRDLLALARRHGLWIIADEIYGRFYYDGAADTLPLAPSLRAHATPEDRLLYVQTFSKNWAMTGWRIGWLEAPEALHQTIGNLVQYSSSGTAVFIQRAAEAALTQGEPLVIEQIKRARHNRDVLVEALSRVPDMLLTPPLGALYLFFGHKRYPDSRALAFSLIDQARVGLAPGSAFGEAGQGFMRLCFLRNTADIEEAAQRLSRFLKGAS